MHTITASKDLSVGLLAAYDTEQMSACRCLHADEAKQVRSSPLGRCALSLPSVA